MLVDTSTFPSSSAGLCHQLLGTTRGSADVDVSVAGIVTYRLIEGIENPLEAHGPTGEGLSALLLG